MYKKGEKNTNWHIRGKHLRHLKADEYLIFEQIHLARTRPQNQTTFLADLELNFCLPECLPCDKESECQSRLQYTDNIYVCPFLKFV